MEQMVVYVNWQFIGDAGVASNQTYIVMNGGCDSGDCHLVIVDNLLPSQDRHLFDLCQL